MNLLAFPIKVLLLEKGDPEMVMAHIDKREESVPMKKIALEYSADTAGTLDTPQNKIHCPKVQDMSCSYQY